MCQSCIKVSLFLANVMFLHQASANFMSSLCNNNSQYYVTSPHHMKSEREARLYRVYRSSNRHHIMQSIQEGFKTHQAIKGIKNQSQIARTVQFPLGTVCELLNYQYLSPNCKVIQDGMN